MSGVTIRSRGGWCDVKSGIVRNATRVASKTEAIVVTNRSRIRSPENSRATSCVEYPGTFQGRFFRHAGGSRWTCGVDCRAGHLVGLVPGGDPDEHEMKARVTSTSRDVVGIDWVKGRERNGMRTAREMSTTVIGGSSRRRSLMLLTTIVYCCWLLMIGECVGQKPINLGGSKKRDVYIAGFFPYGNHVPEGHIGRGVMPAVKLAVEHINEHPTILRDYRLHMWWNDTEVSWWSFLSLWNTVKYSKIPECGFIFSSWIYHFFNKKTPSFLGHDVTLFPFVFLFLFSNYLFLYIVEDWFFFIIIWLRICPSPLSTYERYIIQGSLKIYKLL